MNDFTNAIESLKLIKRLGTIKPDESLTAEDKNLIAKYRTVPAINRLLEYYNRERERANVKFVKEMKNYADKYLQPKPSSNENYLN